MVAMLDQRHLDLRLLSQRGGEADLQSVVSSYSAWMILAPEEPSREHCDVLSRNSAAVGAGYRRSLR
jgi:hypothetical protein